MIFAVALLSAFAFASVASAGNTYTLTLWGASAQYNFYKDRIAGLFSTGGAGCVPATAVAEQKDNAGNTISYSCTNGNGDTYVADLNARASYDGVYAMSGDAVTADKSNANVNGVFCNPGTKTGGVFPASCNPGTSNDTCDYAYRVMADPSGTGTRVMPCDALKCAGGTLTENHLVCKQVDLALADVELTSFLQNTPARNFSSGLGITAPSTWNSYNPMIVPFSFYAHNDITYSTCVGGDKAGMQCSAAGDCDSGNCKQNPLSNITRAQILLITFGSAQLWTDFGAGYGPAENIVLCSREAGSGTLATLDVGLLRKTGVTAPGGYILGWSPNDAIYTDGTTAEMYCVNDNAGAIGFADSDQTAKMTPWVTTSAYPNAMVLNWEGITPSRRAVRNGEYDNFFSKEWIWENTKSPNYGTWSGFKTGIKPYVTWLLNPANGGTSLSYNWWATLCEMTFMKDHDFTYPYYVGASCPQTP